MTTGPAPLTFAVLMRSWRPIALTLRQRRQPAPPSVLGACRVGDQHTAREVADRTGVVRARVTEHSRSATVDALADGGVVRDLEAHREVECALDLLPLHPAVRGLV